MCFNCCYVIDVSFSRAAGETTPTKDPLENDIGDASDLHDGEIAAAEADPDETSL